MTARLRSSALALADRVLAAAGGADTEGAVWQRYRNSSILIARPRDVGSALVVKAGRGWNERHVRIIAEDTSRVGARVAADPLLRAVLVVPRLLATSVEPPLACFEFIEGADASEVVREGMRSGLAGDRGALEDICRRWGRGLAAYHVATIPDVERRDHADVERALRRMAKWAGLPWSAVEHRTRTAWVVRSFVDVGLHNVRLLEDTRVAALDWPTRRLGRLVQQDLAGGLAWIDDALRDAPLGARSELRRQMRRAFLEGWKELGPVGALEGSGAWLLRFSLTWAHLSWMRTAAHRRHPLHAASSAARYLRGVVLVRVPNERGPGSDWF